MQRFMIILVLGLAVAGCASTGPSGSSVGAISAEAEQAQRPLRQAYALKFLQGAVPEDQYRELARMAMEKGLVETAKRFAPDNPDELANTMKRIFLPEVERRFPEVMEFVSGAYADVYTTDELRRASEIVSSSSFLKVKARQPLTEEDLREMAILKPGEVFAALEKKKAAVEKLAGLRGEIWGRRLGHELYERNPTAFQLKPI